MASIHVLVTASTSDLMVDGVCAEIRERDDMHLVEDRVLAPREVRTLLPSIPPEVPCALILIGPFEHTEEVARYWLEKRKHLVVLRVRMRDAAVRISVHDVGMNRLVNALEELLDKCGQLPSERMTDVQLTLPAPANEDEPVAALPPPSTPANLLEAAIDWVHHRLRAALGRLEWASSTGEVSIQDARLFDYNSNRSPRTRLLSGSEVAQADDTLAAALKAARDEEPLARLARTLRLSPFEFGIVILALAAELDPRYQRWISLQNAGYQTGSLGLYAELLDAPPDVATALAESGRLTRWRLIEGGGCAPAADQPLRLEPRLRAWLLGARGALADDPRLQQLLRNAPWPGSALVDDVDRMRAAALIDRVEAGCTAWIVLAGDHQEAWRAAIEAGAGERRLLRAELGRLHRLEAAEVEEAAIRLARLGRLSGAALMLDLAGLEEGADADANLRILFAAVARAGCPAAIIAPDTARLVRLLGDDDYELESQEPASANRSATLRKAAEQAGAELSEEAAESLANLYPLQLDGLEQAMRLALARPLAVDSPEARRTRFIAACKDVAAEGASGLAQRIEPIFDLADIVLPPDRKDQLEEIVGNVRYAPKVLEGWRFRDQLPYGLGVTALFHGPSGTGKTMAAMAVARRLGVHLLRIDLSRVVSKYIGDTEKNLDRCFHEAKHSGATLLFDEADALMSRRSEVKDAHDRYANMEVAYLLQRIEAHEGLVILTTNLRQNLDSAFLRRLRFIIDFPRPDAAAREEIWRRCLPAESHELDDAAFRQLGRRIDLTGGSIRQITLRAAFVAAAAGTRINAAHIAHACRAEFAKLGLPPVDLDPVVARHAA